MKLPSFDDPLSSDCPFSSLLWDPDTDELDPELRNNLDHADLCEDCPNDQKLSFCVFPVLSLRRPR